MNAAPHLTLAQPSTEPNCLLRENCRPQKWPVEPQPETPPCGGENQNQRNRTNRNQSRIPDVFRAWLPRCFLNVTIRVETFVMVLLCVCCLLLRVSSLLSVVHSLRVGTPSHHSIWEKETLSASTQNWTEQTSNFIHYPVFQLITRQPYQQKRM